MPKQHTSSHTGTRKKSSTLPVYLSVLLVVASAAAFVSAFYLLDGASLVAEMYDSFFAEEPAVGPGGSSEQTRTTDATGTPETTSTVTLEGIVLPAGMPLEFALRLWQEQVDSQKNIQHLVDGEVVSLAIEGIERRGGRAMLDVTARFKDGTSAPGVLEMVQFGDKWFFAKVTGLRESETGGLADDVSSSPGGGVVPLPDVEDVDVDLLNVILAEQLKSAPVLEEYATGQVLGVRVVERTSGAGTMTLGIEMDETHETGVGDIVLISGDVGGKPYWFAARFTKR